VIAEIDRAANEINIYIDGKLQNGIKFGKISVKDDISNMQDFTIGRSSVIKDNYFKGAIDYLRISKGTLCDAETKIDELYAWEFGKTPPIAK
jgi:hypothetical protein